MFGNTPLDAFKALLGALCIPPVVSGQLHHTVVLALGLIGRDLQAAGFGEEAEPTFAASGLSRSHFEEYVTMLATLVKGLTRTRDAEGFPIAFKRDKAGYIFPDQQASHRGDPGSPANASVNKKIAMSFVKGLSQMEAYQAACNSPDMKWVCPALCSVNLNAKIH